MDTDTGKGQKKRRKQVALSGTQNAMLPPMECVTPQGHKSTISHRSVTGGTTSPGSNNTGNTKRSLRALKVRSLDMVTPRPRMRFEYVDTDMREKTHERPLNFSRQSIPVHPTVDELAEEYNSQDLRILMERAERRHSSRRNRSTTSGRSRSREDKMAEKERMRRFRQDLENRSTLPISPLRDEITGQSSTSAYANNVDPNEFQRSWLRTSDSDLKGLTRIPTPVKVHSNTFNTDPAGSADLGFASTANSQLLEGKNVQLDYDGFYTPCESPGLVQMDRNGAQGTPGTMATEYTQDYFDAQSMRSDQTTPTISNRQPFGEDKNVETQASLANVDSEASWFGGTSAIESSTAFPHREGSIPAALGSVVDPDTLTERPISRDLTDLNATYATLTSQTGEWSDTSSIEEEVQLKTSMRPAHDDNSVWHESVGKTPVYHAPHRRASTKSREGLLNIIDDANAVEFIEADS